MRNPRLLPVLAWLAAATLTALAAPLTSSFTYQGRLTEGANAANGQYDLTFRLFDAVSGGSPAGAPVTNLNVAVSNGLFTTSLDFGSGPFNGNAYWLEIRVRPGGGGGFNLLSPRQPITAVPYALNALSLKDGAVTANSIAPGQTVLSVNGLRDGVTIAGAGGVTVTPSGNTLTISGGGWALQGNAGTSPAQNFLGTTDSQPLELRVNSARAWRAEPTTSTANIIAGAPANHALPGAFGASIAGGGQAGEPNVVGGAFGSIGGGRDNLVEIDGQESAIVGGHLNTIYTNAWDALIGGGSANFIDSFSDFAVVAGGSNNWIGFNAPYTAIVGGQDNYIGAESTHAAVGGGYYNYVGDNANYATVAGGSDNWVKTGALYAAIPGGAQAAAVSYGQQAYASGMDSDWGDAQASLYVLRRTTTNAVAGELFLDGAAERMKVPQGGSWTFQITIVARNASGSSACYKAEGGIKNVGGTVSLIGTPTVTSIVADAGFAPASPTIAADNAAKALSIRVTGVAAQHIKWVARVQTVELKF